MQLKLLKKLSAYGNPKITIKIDKQS